MKDLNQLIIEADEQRRKVLKAQEDILSSARKEGREFNSDENLAYDKAEEDFNRYDGEVRRLQALKEKQERSALNLSANNPTPNIEIVQEETREESKLSYDVTFDKYLRFGNTNLTREERSLLKENFQRDNEKRAQTVTTTGGGYAIPTGFSNRVEQVMAYYGPMMEPGVCGALNTASGNPFNYPTLDDTSNTGRLLAINTAVTTTDLTFGQVTFDAYKYSSDQILVPVELLEDENVNLEQVISNSIGERLGRIINAQLTTGTGSSQPNGVVTASAAGKTAASATAITRDEIVDLIHSVDRAYRNGPSVGFMFHDSTLAAIKKLSIGSSDDRPLWQPSIVAGEPDRLEGFQYWVNNDMAEIATTNKTILFGDFSKYLVRRAGAMRMRRLDERYADTDQVGYVAFYRIDGDLIATGSIKHLVQA